MAARNPITLEELNNNYEYKVIKKVIMREFPWVKDVTILNPDTINNYNILFVDFVINPIELQQEMGWPIMWYVLDSIVSRGEMTGPFLSSFFKIDYRPSQDIANKIEKVMASVHESPALPEDLKIPEDRSWGIGVWRVTKDTLVSPEGYDPVYTRYSPTT